MGQSKLSMTREPNIRRILYYFLYIITTSLSLIVVYLIVSWIKKDKSSGNNETKTFLIKRSEDFAEVHKKIADMINRGNIKENSYHYSEYPHPPGSQQNMILAKEMAKNWKKYGFDKTELFKYRVFLSFPKQPAEVHLKKNRNILKIMQIKNEPAFGESEKKGRVIYPFNAYSISGDVTGEVVFVNYGLPEDYKKLENMNVILKKKIFLIRYGTPRPRSLLIADAYRQGSVGVIFYSDPYDYTYKGQEYPNGWMLNKYGVQRGSIYELYGDALSLGYPSKEHYYRANSSSYKYSSRIPAQPVSAQVAKEIFKFMEDDSKSLPSTFQGALNVPYRLQSGTGRKITLKVWNELSDKDTYVVCGSLFGREEPDRYVILGNHRDAWTYGASDPVSGSAVMTEVLRVLGKAKKKMNYRPRRSIMICSWGAEEAAMLGSTEWAEDNANFISTKVVAYLNVDQAVEGNYTIQIKSLDHMAESIFEASKHVKCPEDHNKTLFQDMNHKHSMLLKETSDLIHPQYSSPGGVSDNKCFSQRHGVAVSDYRYTYSRLDFPKLVVHSGHYHTLYDSFDWMSKFIDPSFDHHETIGKLWVKHALLIADSEIIPLDLEAYARQVQNNFHIFETKYKPQLDIYNVSLAFPKKRIKEMVLKAKEFQDAVKDLRKGMTRLTDNQLRIVNDIIMNFEKNFILKSEVGKQQLKHIIYSTHENFFGIASAINDDPGVDWDNVRQEITLFVWCVDMAIDSLGLAELRITQLDEQKLDYEYYLNN